jgi:hypothetical protein
MRSRMVMALLACACGAWQSAAQAAEGVITFGTGAEYSSGNYGSDQKTEIFYVPFNVKYEAEPWSLRLVVPYIRITGPGNVVGAGPDRITLPGAGGPVRTEDGLGDVVASATFNALGGRNAPLLLDFTAKVKFGTADRDRGLGTGEVDYSLQADVYKPMGALTPFATLGYRWFGDPPGVDLRDVPYASLGAAYRVSDQTSVGVAYDFRPRIIEGGGKVSEITAFVSQRLARDVKLQAYAIAGLADASPDFGVGLALNFIR